MAFVPFGASFGTHASASGSAERTNFTRSATIALPPPVCAEHVGASVTTTLVMTHWPHAGHVHRKGGRCPIPRTFER